MEDYGETRCSFDLDVDFDLDIDLVLDSTILSQMGFL